MKKFIIHVYTNWCQMDEYYRAEAESEFDLEDSAEQAAYDNFCSFDLYDDILEDLGYDPDELSDEEREDILCSIDESNYYGYVIYEYEGLEEEWESYVKL